MPPKSDRTCDLCRKRKIKCVNEGFVGAATRPCEGCAKLEVECRYDYVKQKPGRKNSFAPVRPSEQNNHASGPTSPHNRSSHNGASASTSFNPYPSPSKNLLASLRRPSETKQESSYQTPLDSSLHILSAVQGSANLINLSQVALESGDLATDFTLPQQHDILQTEDPQPSWLDSLLQGSAEWFSDAPSDGAANIFEDLFNLAPDLTTDEQSQLLSLASPDVGSTKALSETSGQPNSASILKSTMPKSRQKEISWDELTHFISIWLRHLYPLLPLVHKPTFVQDLALRRDLRDPGFKALLHSIVSYVISQMPTSRIISDAFDIDRLKTIQRSCHRISRGLQGYHYGTPDLMQITTILFDVFYLLSIGLAHTAGARLGQAIQLAYTMGLHDDVRTHELGLNAIEVQLRRRVFWQLYASDKTRAISGLPMLICDFQGVCSLPEAIDDDFLLPQGYFAHHNAPQPLLLVGFVAVSRVFQILSECFFRQRCSAMNAVTLGLSGQSRSEQTEDLAKSMETRLHQILEELPPEIQEPSKVAAESYRQIYGMQRANILITTAICKFALYDLRAANSIEESTLKRERETIAREMHSLLMNIPVDDLASNGESVRGKVFHILSILYTQISPADVNYSLVRDWYAMFQAISFIQMPVPISANDYPESRQPSPPIAPTPAQS